MRKIRDYSDGFQASQRAQKRQSSVVKGQSMLSGARYSRPRTIDE